jgi:hypothetical protein
MNPSRERHQKANQCRKNEIVLLKALEQLPSRSHLSIGRSRFVTKSDGPTVRNGRDNKGSGELLVITASALLINDLSSSVHDLLIHIIRQILQIKVVPQLDEGDNFVPQHILGMLTN